MASRLWLTLAAIALAAMFLAGLGGAPAAAGAFALVAAASVPLGVRNRPAPEVVMVLLVGGGALVLDGASTAYDAYVEHAWTGAPVAIPYAAAVTMCALGAALVAGFWPRRAPVGGAT